MRKLYCDRCRKEAKALSLIDVPYGFNEYGSIKVKKVELCNDCKKYVEKRAGYFTKTSQAERILFYETLLRSPYEHVNEKTCKDCLHCSACDYMYQNLTLNEIKGEYPEGAEDCPQFIDISFFIHLPADFNKKVYYIVEDWTDEEKIFISEETVTDISSKGLWCSASVPPEDDCSTLIEWDEFGVDAFVNYEDAVREKQRREEKGDIT